MQALRREVASTAKSLRTTRKSASSASAVIMPVSSENQDEAEQSQRRSANDVQLHFWQPQASHDRLDDPDGDSNREETGNEGPESRPTRRTTPWRRDVEDDDGEHRELERAGVQDQRQIGATGVAPHHRVDP